MKICPIVIILLSFISLKASGEDSNLETRLLRKSHGWHSYSYSKGKERVCYMTEKAEPLQIVITNRINRETHEWSHDVISILAKTKFKPNSKLHLVTDRGVKFELLADKNSAWSATEANDYSIRMALAHDLSLSVSGEFENGTPFKTRFSLIGFQMAINIIDALCPYLAGSKNPPISRDSPSKFGSGRLPEGI